MAATGTGGGATGGYTGYTGMTGMRTGTSRPMPTTRPTGTGGRIPTKGSGYGSKFTEMWNNLDPKHKVLIVAGIVGLILLSLSVQFYSKSNEFVALYDTPITSTQDIADITSKLNELGIKYKISNDKERNIMVHPSLKASTKMTLAQYSLPHAQVMNSNTPSDNSMKIQTSDEIAVQNKLRLQGDLIMSIRSISGVGDATVQIVPGDEEAFLPENAKQTTAAVMVKMQPNANLVPAQVQGIVNLVAFSVRGLKPGNVVVLDQNGMELTKRDSVGESGMTAMAISPQDMEKKLSMQKEIQTTAQEMLDKVLGPNKSMVKVNVTLNTSQSETTSKIFENGVTVVKSSESETLKNGGKSGLPGGVTQMGGVLSARKTGSDYERTKVVEKNEPNSVVTRTITAPGSIQRLSVGVFVDNLRPEQIEKIKDGIKGAVGYDMARGDSIQVESMPFAMTNPMIASMRNEMNNHSAGYSPFANHGRQNWAFYLMFFPLAILAGVMAVFLLRQRRVVADQSRMIFSEGPAANATDIADLLTDKIGKPSFAPPTQVNTTEELEKLAKEKPTKVAELLKSTWLAEKGR